MPVPWKDCASNDVGYFCDERKKMFARSVFSRMDLSDVFRRFSPG